MFRRAWLALLLLCAATAAHAQTFPNFTGLVVDAADVLPPQVEADLTAKLEALQKDTKRQLVVATIPDTGGRPVDDYGYRLGRAWGVGLRDVNNGAILFIAPNEPAGQRGPRIEVGRGLEPIVTDALAGQIIRDDMLPRLKANGDIAGAMTAGTDALIAQLRASPEEAQARTDAAIKDFDRDHARRQSSGGGIPVGLVFGGIVLLFVILPMFARRGGRGRAYHGDGGALPIVLWSIANELTRNDRGDGGGGGGGPWGGSSGGGWGGGSGGGSDGSWGGGGFTGGGGGDFGGGGASGDW